MLVLKVVTSFKLLFVSVMSCRCLIITDVWNMWSPNNANSWQYYSW